MTETFNITYDQLLHEERLRLLNAGCLYVSNLNVRYGAVNYDEQVTSADLTENVLTVQVGSRMLTIDGVLSFGDYAVHPHHTEKTTFTVFVTGPHGGPSPAISFAPREDVASQSLIAQALERLNTCYRANQKRQSDTRKQELLGVLQSSLVGREPVSVELFKKEGQYGDDEHGIKLVYSDGSYVTIGLHDDYIDGTQLEVNGREVPRYF